MIRFEEMELGPNESDFDLYGRDTSACWHAESRRAKEMKTRKEFADLVMGEAAPAASAQIFRACMSRDRVKRGRPDWDIGTRSDAPNLVSGPCRMKLNIIVS